MMKPNSLSKAVEPPSRNTSNENNIKNKAIRIDNRDVNNLSFNDIVHCFFILKLYAYKVRNKKGSLSLIV